VIPVYEDPEDAEALPHDLPNQAPFAWSWLSTLNRVNSQVHKVRPPPAVL
jgi:tRNA-splicing endonuclease subunit Sen2